MTEMPRDVYRPETDHRDAPRAVLIVTGDKTEDLEFFYPYYRFVEAGFKVDVATPNGGTFKGKQGLGLKETKKVSEINVGDYELLYLPGGKAPEELKKNEDVLEVVTQFSLSGKPIAAICHGPQILAEAQVIEGHKIAAWPEVENEIREAGGKFVNQETVSDEPFITARWPGDLPAHMKAVIALLNRSSLKLSNNKQEAA